MTQSAKYEQLRELHGFDEKEGFVCTDLERVNFFWATDPVERSP